MQIAEKRRAARRLVLFLFIVACCVFIFLLNIGFGSVRIPLRDVAAVLTGGEIDSATHHAIVTDIRLPRALAALAGGACLAVSGLLLQIFFSNPIVEPYVLGISSGSMMFVGIVILGGYTFGISMATPMFMFWGALAGALLVMLVVVFAAGKVKSIITLLIIGLMSGYICSAVTSMLTTFADKEAIAGFALWSMGSFSGFTWQQVLILLVVTGIFSVLALLMSKPLNALLLGEKYAQSMGVTIRVFRILIVVIASVLTAVITAFAGPISFIGLAVPHLVRVGFGTSDNRVLLPASILSGALMTCLCDLCARLLFAPKELPIGAITSFIGAPLVIYLVSRRNNGL
jgi:iron complex transport system permease protein